VSDAPPTIAIAIEIDDVALADRLASLLGNVAGLALVAAGQPANAAIVSRSAPAANDSAGELTPRERDVLALMAEGRSNAAIASALFVTEKAVGKHTNNIFTKLDLPPAPDDNRRVLAVLAWLGV
jgi:DNA-binding NarL/FixJ family response regulator